MDSKGIPPVHSRWLLLKLPDLTPSGRSHSDTDPVIGDLGEPEVNLESPPSAGGNGIEQSLPPYQREGHPTVLGQAKDREASVVVAEDCLTGPITAVQAAGGISADRDVPARVGREVIGKYGDPFGGLGGRGHPD